MNAIKTENTTLRPAADEAPAVPAPSTEAGTRTAALTTAQARSRTQTGETGASTTGTVVPGARTAPEARTETPSRDRAGAPARKDGANLRDADGMAVASFVLGLVGLLAFNLLLGPCAIVLSGLALLRGTGRRGRALLGMGLGAADLVVLAATTSADHSFSWSLNG